MRNCSIFLVEGMLWTSGIEGGPTFGKERWILMAVRMHTADQWTGNNEHSNACTLQETSAVLSDEPLKLASRRARSQTNNRSFPFLAASTPQFASCRISYPCLFFYDPITPSLISFRCLEGMSASPTHNIQFDVQLANLPSKTSLIPSLERPFAIAYCNWILLLTGFKNPLRRDSCQPTAVSNSIGTTYAEMVSPPPDGTTAPTLILVDTTTCTPAAVAFAT